MYTMRKGGKALHARAHYFRHTSFLPWTRAKKTPGEPGVFCFRRAGVSGAAILAVRGMVAGCLCRGFGHVLAFLGLAVPLVALAVINLRT